MHTVMAGESSILQQPFPQNTHQNIKMLELETNRFSLFLSPSPGFLLLMYQPTIKQHVKWNGSDSESWFWAENSLFHARFEHK